QLQHPASGSAPGDRAEHRQHLRRGQRPGRRPRRQRAHRHRPGAVRHHLRGEPGGPLDHRPPRRILGSELMTTPTLQPQAALGGAGQLPKHISWYVLAGGLALSFVVLLLFAEPTPASVIILGGAIYVAAIWISSRIVEGARRATDRLATAVVTSAFALAMIPVVSLLVTVVD